MRPDLQAKIDAARARYAETQHAATDFLADTRTYEHDTRDLPEWLTELRPHQIDAVQEIDEAFDRGAQVVFVEAPTGCLAGETELTLNRGGRGFRMSIRDLYEKFNGRIDYGKQWDTTIPTRIAQGQLETMTVRSGEIEDVVYSGLKDTVIVHIWDEKSLRLTPDHQVMTEDGWREIGDLGVGDRILVNAGRSKRKTKPTPKITYPQVMGLRGHPRAGLRREHEKGGYRVPRHVLVVEAELNGISYIEYVKRLQAGESDFKFVDGATHHVHHIDRDPTNYRPENLEILTIEEHRRHHGDHTRVAEQLKYRAIERVTPGGPAMTFDIVMAGKEPHFIAEGIFVHNSGKTILGELARRRNGESGLYVCSGKSLQDQFARDFDYAGVVKGRSNYPTLLRNAFPEITAADCDKMRADDACTWCGVEVGSCPYERAKTNALGNRLATLNTTYALTEMNYAGGFSGRDVVVVDEADLLEEELMRFVEFHIGPGLMRELKLTAPRKGVHAATVEEWLKNEVQVAAERERAKLPGNKDPKVMKKRKRLTQIVSDVNRICAAGIEFGEDGWVRVYDKKHDNSFTLKPVKVAEDAGKLLWRHGKKWVLMSATLVSVQEMVESLGVEEAGLEWDEVHVPPVFAVENRVIVASGVADMTRKGQQAGGVERLLEDGIRVVVEKHANENVLIHTHTYALARDVTMWLNQNPDVVGGREVHSYTGARERDTALERYKQHGGILVAPSMDRGIDLPGEECRVQVICKLPMPYLGDAQISARMNARGGELWYGVLTARGLIQMTGRAVRSVDDWATCYVLDSTFGRWKKRNKTLLPEWWQDAVKYVPGKYFAREVEARVKAHGELRGGDDE